MIIYQVLPRLWGSGHFSDWQEPEFDYLKTLGVSHIWFTGVPRHATGKPFVKGNPGSPYAIEDYYDVNPYLADVESERMDEFKSLINRVHASGLKLLTDFVPNHVAREYHGDIPRLNHCDADWTDTLKIDYNAPGAYDKMYQIVRFWAGLGVDGVRCDMVEMVPLALFTYIIGKIKAEFPDFKFIAEVYSKEGYRRYVREAGFDLLYDKSGLYDLLVPLMADRGDAREISWNWQRLGDLQPHMLNFLENHDEERLRAPDYAALGLASLFNGASFMLYFGEEVGENAARSERRRTSIFNWEKIPSVEHLVRYIRTGEGLTATELQTLERHRSILSLASRIQSWANYDLCYCNVGLTGFDSEKHFAFLRYRPDKSEPPVLVACNFSPLPAAFDLRIPRDARALSGWETERVHIELSQRDISIL